MFVTVGEPEISNVVDSKAIILKMNESYSYIIRTVPSAVTGTVFVLKSST